MTCQDCIHCTDNECEIWDIPMHPHQAICDRFTYNDGAYENGSWHCPRCGKEVSEWGLCDECNSIYLIPKGGQIKPHMLHGWVYDDSWESVSK